MTTARGAVVGAGPPRKPVGIAVEALGGGFGSREIGVNDEATFGGASLIKALILVELLRRVEKGEVG